MQCLQRRDRLCISRIMKRFLSVLALALTLAACAKKSTVDISSSQPAVQTQARSEPIFYNGKQYNMAYTYNEPLRAFDVKVSGLGAKQGRDARNIVFSGVRYFACPDPQTAQILGEPRYTGSDWLLQARCA
jgi:hypothetical protein